MVWARIDGQRIAGNSELEAQARRDESDCRALAEKATEGQPTTAMAQCMDKKGYRLIPLPQGETYVPIAPEPPT